MDGVRGVMGVDLSLPVRTVAVRQTLLAGSTCFPPMPPMAHGHARF